METLTQEGVLFTRGLERITTTYRATTTYTTNKQSSSKTPHLQVFQPIPLPRPLFGGLLHSSLLFGLC